MSSKGLTGEAAERNRQRAKEWREKYPDRVAETKRRYRERNPEAFRQMRREASRKWFADESNRDGHNERVRIRRAGYKQQVIDHYGGCCACPGCHVHHAELLTVDHKAGDGAEHRRVIGKGREIYLAIVKADFPDDYQLLCGSCNLAKANKVACPVAGQDH